MNTLPKDMLLEILTKIDDSDLANLCQVDRRFYQVCKNEVFWKNRGLKTFGPEFMQLHDEVKDSSFKKTYRIALDLMFLKTWRLRNLKSIMNVFHLQTLDLSNNQLKEIPKELSQLQNLGYLYLDNNQLKEVPKELGHLQNLRYLNLFNNQLKEVPKELGHLQNLYYLDLSNNQLKEVPKELGRMQNLERLFLNNNQLKEVPKELGELQNLHYISLYGNQLKEVPKEIRDIPRIWITLK